MAGVPPQPDGGEGANGEGWNHAARQMRPPAVSWKHEIGGRRMSQKSAHRLLVFGEQFVQVAGGFGCPTSRRGRCRGRCLVDRVEKWRHG